MLDISLIISVLQQRKRHGPLSNTPPNQLLEVEIRGKTSKNRYQYQYSREMFRYSWDKETETQDRETETENYERIKTPKYSYNLSRDSIGTRVERAGNKGRKNSKGIKNRRSRRLRGTVEDESRFWSFSPLPSPSCCLLLPLCIHQAHDEPAHESQPIPGRVHDRKDVCFSWNRAVVTQ